MGDLLGFGRDPRERAEALRRALAPQRHPAGSRRTVTPKPDPGIVWASERRYTAEERRAAILAAKPVCSCCERPFHYRFRVPPDLICADCKRDMRDKGPPETDPALF